MGRLSPPRFQQNFFPNKRTTLKTVILSSTRYLHDQHCPGYFLQYQRTHFPRLRLFGRSLVLLAASEPRNFQIFEAERRKLIQRQIYRTKSPRPRCFMQCKICHFVIGNWYLILLTTGCLRKRSFSGKMGITSFQLACFSTLNMYNVKIQTGDNNNNNFIIFPAISTSNTIP